MRRATAKLEAVRKRVTSLLCELHAHTTWSDGSLTLRELIDLYGHRGFDVVCVTDHSLRGGREHVTEQRHPEYVAAVAEEAARAEALYDLLVLPGLELTYHDDDPALCAHAVAVGLEAFVSLEAGLEPALAAAREQGAALIAAHPYTLETASRSPRGTGRWHADPRLAELVDRYELVNRHDVFAWVAEQRLPAVATGDFHRPEHLATWKTFLPCAKERDAIVEFLRSPRPASLVPLGDPGPLDELCAA